MSNHKLSKNVYLDKIRSVVQQITSQTDLTVLIQMLMTAPAVTSTPQSL